jgi:hypothetical protein
MAAQPAANIKTVAAGNHDVEKKKSGRLAFCVYEYVGGVCVDANGKTCSFQMVLHQARNVCVILKHEYGLAQAGCSLVCVHFFVK